MFRKCVGACDETKEKENCRPAHKSFTNETIANEVRPRSILMKEDVVWNHQDRLLPILDTKIRIVNGQVVHHHYTKSMSSLEVVLNRSSMSLGSKMSILVQEGCRIVRNCSPDLQWEVKL